MGGNDAFAVYEAARDNAPVLLLEHKALYRRINEEVPAGDYTVPLGQEAVFGAGAAEALAQEGIRVEIIDLRTLAPLDEGAVLASVRKTSRVIVLHEDTLTGGVGAEIAARIAEKAFDCLDAPVARIAAPDTPVPYSPPLENAFLPSAAQVVARARWVCRY